MTKAAPNLVDSLAAASPSKPLLERRLVEMGIGILSALQTSQMTFDDARREFFNLDNYQALNRQKLSAALTQFFQWGMELGDVADLAPGGLAESYWRMSRIASRLMKQPAPRSSKSSHSRTRKSA